MSQTFGNLKDLSRLMGGASAGALGRCARQNDAQHS